jgi:3-phytase
MKPYILLFLIIGTLSCVPKRVSIILPEVKPINETSPVKMHEKDDSADDPAFWIHPLNTKESLIIGTVKGYGLEVYDLDGVVRQSLKIGNPNNVDVRQGIQLSENKKLDITACSDRSANQILVFSINPENRELDKNPIGQIPTDLDEVYGFCLYHSYKSGNFYAFINGKSGEVQQYELGFEGEKVIGKLVRSFSVNSQPEGMMADDQLGVLYVGEEDKGVWKIGAEPEDGNQPKLVADSGQDNPQITYDIEGITIYPTSETQGYLIVSSQGNNSYAVFTREKNNAYLGSFRIGDGRWADGTYDTDGIEVTAVPLGDKFPKGMFLAQDGENTDPDGKRVPQNFKMVDWREIENLMSLW